MTWTPKSGMRIEGVFHAKIHKIIYRASYPLYDKRNLDSLYYIASKMKIENKVRDIMEVVYE